MGNHEERILVDSVHLFMAFKRTKDDAGTPAKCIRTIIKDYDIDLEILKTKLKLLGGTWRIHKTVNARDVEKARKNLMHTLIEFPEKAGYLDSMWRTALLQKNAIYGDKKWMLDIDTYDIVKIEKIKDTILCCNGEILEEVQTPSGGRHIITIPFDVREVCELGDVTLIRDGYIFITTVGDK